MRERLGRYEEAPSDELWEKIASKKKKEQVWPFFLEPIGVIIIGVALLIGPTDEVKRDEVMKDEVTRDEVTTITKDEVTKGGMSTVKPVVFQDIVLSESVLDKNQEQPPVSTSPSLIEAAEIEVHPFDSTQRQTTDSKPETRRDSSSAPKEIVPPFKKPKSKFQLYVSVTPSLSFQKMTPSPNDQVIVEGFVSRSPMSLKRFGFSIDAGLQRDINRYFGYYGGLSFHRQNQELSYQYYNTQAEVTRIGDSFTYEIFRQERTKTFNYSMTNIGVSAGVLVTLKGEKLKHKFGAGLMYTRSLNASNTYVAYKLSYRNEVKVNDYLSWFIEPNFVYSFISKEKLEEPFSLKPYRAGMSLGILYRFKN